MRETERQGEHADRGTEGQRDRETERQRDRETKRSRVSQNYPPGRYVPLSRCPKKNNIHVNTLPFMTLYALWYPRMKRGRKGHKGQKGQKG